MSCDRENCLYHSPMEFGFWTSKDVYHRDIYLRDGKVLTQVVPIGIRESEDGNNLEMVLSLPEGNIYEPVDNFPGLRVVRGDSKTYPYEVDDELLIELDYLNPRTEQIEEKPRRIRPVEVRFGIHGGAGKEDFERGAHRARGESADFYLVGYDTRYDSQKDPWQGLRNFPFWRCGVWGDAVELQQEYLPLIIKEF